MADWPHADFKNYLLSVGVSNTLFPNHWKKVMYQALATDETFCQQAF
ncbi:hypothetical protein MTBPR1_30117 [Candidatus Terasakiella magnetica]|uniref:Uncharacterized protein n=1 Tax=Candidatus Terasakiella magnetica TaxID=1867952 RepID=A0A1C3RHI6_9PROT|nr:hypothetical protein MTBPR1_30117 [Candidatus Terasakiella magnetica]